MCNEVLRVVTETRDVLGISPATTEAILSNSQIQIKLATGQQPELTRLKLNRSYFEDGCACIHSTKTLQPCPTNMPDAEAVTFYERHCKCSRNYVRG